MIAAGAVAAAQHFSRSSKRNASVRRLFRDLTRPRRAGCAPLHCDGARLAQRKSPAAPAFQRIDFTAQRSRFSPEDLMRRPWLLAAMAGLGLVALDIAWQASTTGAQNPDNNNGNAHNGKKVVEGPL